MLLQLLPIRMLQWMDGASLRLIGSTKCGRRASPTCVVATRAEAGITRRDVYSKVYDAERPEPFMSPSVGAWSVTTGRSSFRRDSKWNVPEPELVLVVNAFGEVVGIARQRHVVARHRRREPALTCRKPKCSRRRVCSDLRCTLLRSTSFVTSR